MTYHLIPKEVHVLWRLSILAHWVMQWDLINVH